MNSNKPGVYLSSSGPRNPGDFANILNPSPVPPTPAAPQPASQHNPASTASQPVGQHNPIQPVFHNVADPLMQGIRGYINPATGLPYPSSQPYAGNLAAAMQAEAQQHGSPSLGFSRNFGPNEQRFFQDFQRHNFPDRHPNLYYNSHPIRKELRNCR